MRSAVKVKRMTLSHWICAASWRRNGGLLWITKKTAVDILAAIGGSDNIVSAAHCATRLRLVIADNSKVSKSVLETVNIGDSLLKLV